MEVQMSEHFENAGALLGQVGQLEVEIEVFRFAHAERQKQGRAVGHAEPEVLQMTVLEDSQVSRASAVDDVGGGHAHPGENRAQVAIDAAAAQVACFADGVQK